MIPEHAPGILPPVGELAPKVISSEGAFRLSPGDPVAQLLVILHVSSLLSTNTAGNAGSPLLAAIPPKITLPLIFGWPEMTTCPKASGEHSTNSKQTILVIALPSTSSQFRA